MQHTLNITLNAAYIHVFIPLEVLIWIRSIAIVLLIVAHALRHVSIAKPQEQPAVAAQDAQPPQLVITPELLDTLRQMLTQATVIEEKEAPLLLTQQAQATDNGKRVKAYLAEHPGAHLRDIAAALTISVTTARKWRTRIQGEGEQKGKSRAKK